MDSVPVYQFSGSVDQVGLGQGEQLREQIADAIDFYSGLLGKNLSRLDSEIAPFITVARRMAPTAMRHISAIAKSASQNEIAVFALNARSELMNNMLIAECTSISHIADNLFAQNWDWARRIAPLMSVQKIQLNDCIPYVTYTEPGMLTKIFINAEGLACQLNILKSSSRLEGLPIHLLLNALANCSSIDDASILIKKNPNGKASHLLMAHNSVAKSFEFTGVEVITRDVSNEPFVHTNHYLGDSKDKEAFPTSHQRFDFVNQSIRDSHLTLNTLIEPAFNSPMRPYVSADTQGFGEVGTVATISFDLKSNRLGVRNANVTSPTWQWIQSTHNN